MNAQLQSKITQFSIKNGYVAKHFAMPICKVCSNDTFTIVMNENEGVAARICTRCHYEHGIGDSDDFIDDIEEVYSIQCTCGSDQFKMMAGLALYDDSESARWLYIGCECSACGLSGVYGDWKNEFDSYQRLLEKI